MTDGRSFTWHDKFTLVIDGLRTVEEKAELIHAITRYGTYGEEPDLSYPLNALFEALREDIDSAIIEE